MRRFKIFPLLLALAACVPPSSVKNGKNARGASGSTSLDSTSGLPADTSVTEVSVRHVEGKQFVAAAELKPVPFDYDAYQLSQEARDVLQANAAYLKAHPDQDVLVEGHCDERGTVEYNLALGQRRAKEVRDYYIRIGVPGKSVATLSLGKEQLPCSESTEDCWSRSRRAESKVRSRTVSNGAKPR